MRKALIALAAAMTAMAALAASAGAIEVDPAGGITASSREIVMLNEGGFINPEITCGLTFVGTLASSVVDAEGAHAGTTTNPSFALCSGGTFRATNVGSWPITYQGAVLGGIKLLAMTQEDVQFTWSLAGVDCNYAGNVGFTIESFTSPLVASGYLFDPNMTLTLQPGSDLFCPPNAGFEGIMSLGTQTFAL